MASVMVGTNRLWLIFVLPLRIKWTRQALESLEDAFKRVSAGLEGSYSLKDKAGSQCT